MNEPTWKIRYVCEIDPDHEIVVFQDGDRWVWHIWNSVVGDVQAENFSDHLTPDNAKRRALDFYNRAIEPFRETAK